MNGRSRLFALTCLAAVVPLWELPAKTADAPPETALESAVKAAYLLNFLKFVEYPAVSGRTICLLGKDALGPVLEESVKTQHVDGTAVRFRQIRSAAQAEGCHVLFLAGDQNGIRSAIAQIGATPVLTVSDRPDFLDQGGMILLFREAGRLQFEIDAERARRAGLRISSKLMVLSRSAR